MKKISLIVAALMLICIGAIAQDKAKEDALLASDVYYSYGYNDYIRLDEATPLTKAPKGYEPVYIAHYGRHGSRYAWNSKTYTWIDEVLTDALSKDNLTDFGKELQAAYKPFAEFAVQHTGELTRKGWDQHRAIAHHMYSNNKALFKKNPKIEAASSSSPRAMMSMAAFCAGLKECNPKLDLWAQMSPVYFSDCIPEASVGKDKIGPQDARPNAHSSEVGDFYHRTVDTDAILGRIFKNIDTPSYEGKKTSFLFELYVDYIGLRSLDFEVELPRLFSDSEFLAMYKYDCANFYRESQNAMTYAPIIKRLVESAEEALAQDRPSVKLRFGHDYVLNQYLVLAGIGTFGKEIPSADEAYLYYPVRKIPMGANIQFIFYRSKKTGDVLVKVLQNGSETTLPVEPVEGPYYRWSDYKAWLEQNVISKIK